jgi:oligoribonuclease (3'-5' exoribonuclease)
MFRYSGYGRRHGFVDTGEDQGGPPAPMMPSYHRWLSEGGGGEFAPAPPSAAALFNVRNRYNALWLFCDLECTGLDPTAPNFGVLEIAACVVNNGMSVIDSFHVVVHQPPHVIAAASKWCKKHFCSRAEGGNDLFAQCEASAITEEAAGTLLEAFIMRHAKPRRRNHDDTEEEGARKRQLFQTVAFQTIDDEMATHADGPPAAAADAVEPPPTGGPPPEEPGVYRLFLAGNSVYFDRNVLLTKYPYLARTIGHKTIELSSLLEICRRWRPDLLRSLPPAQDTHRALVDVMESVALLGWFWRAFICV